MRSTKTFPEIAARVRAVRLAFSDDTATAWAARHGFERRQYSAWETGANRIPVDHAETLARLYGLTLDWIYLGRADGLAASTLQRLSDTRPNRWTRSSSDRS